MVSCEPRMLVVIIIICVRVCVLAGCPPTVFAFLPPVRVKAHGQMTDIHTHRRKLERQQSKNHILVVS